MKGICLLSQLPVRSDYSHRAEMVTQLLFGETYEVIFENKGWMQIRIDYDQYEGWIDASVFVLYEDAANDPPVTLSGNPVSWLQSESNGIKFPVVLGSTLPNLMDDQLNINGSGYKFDGTSVVPLQMVHPENIIRFALKYLHAPYFWGGRSIFGIDCSGFVQMVFKLNGISLLRDTVQQAGQGTDVSFIEEARVGDLCFFENPEGKIIHVGIYMGEGTLIHASGKVRMDTVDHFGIYNAEIQAYSHQLRLIKRNF